MLGHQLWGKILTRLFKFKSIGMWGVLGLIFYSTLCFGQTDPNDPSSPNYKGKKQVYQKKYSASLGASMGRGFDEFSESFGAYSFSGSYALGKTSITLNADYSHPLDGDTDDVRPWRMSDLELVWNLSALKPLEVGGKNINLVPRLTYRIPNSATSRYASSYGSVVGTLISSLNVGRFSFILSPRLTLSYHEYETADQAGFVKNTPFAAALVGTVRATVIKDVYLSGTLFVHNGWTYDFDVVPVTGVSSNIYYQATPTLGLMAYMTWRDRVYSNNSLFDDETSSMGLGVITNF